MKTRLLLLGVIVALVAVFWRLSEPPRPDPRMVGLAVRATLYALPTATPYEIVVTQIVEVTATPLSPATATATLTPTEPATPAPTAAPESAIPPPEEALADAPPPVANTAEIAAAAPEVVAAQAAVEEPVVVAAAASPGDCPATSGNAYTTIPVAGGGLDHPDAEHGDLNLALRGYQPVDAAPALFDKDGPVDGDPPQLAGLFADLRAPAFGQSFAVNDWDWACGAHGCAGAPLSHVDATLVALRSNGGETLYVPRRGAQIFGGGYKALVLYAEPTRITLGYTRDDTVANGYVVHLENLCVDPELLAVYRGSVAAGRGYLPALREDQPLGSAGLGDVLVAVRDRGVFFDPRSRRDWWQGY